MSDSSKRSDAQQPTTEPQTLNEGDIVAEHGVDRRSALVTMGAVASAGAMGTVLNGCFATAPGPAYAQPAYQQPGYGQPAYVQPARVQTGISDADSGPGSDPAGYGRGGVRPGPTYVAPAGVTDGDSGRWSDPAGAGRGAPRGVYSGVTDGDSGRWSDPVGAGRGHR